jgi:hypothetical protein
MIGCIASVMQAQQAPKRAQGRFDVSGLLFGSSLRRPSQYVGSANTGPAGVAKNWTLRYITVPAWQLMYDTQPQAFKGKHKLHLYVRNVTDGKVNQTIGNALRTSWERKVPLLAVFVRTLYNLLDHHHILTWHTLLFCGKSQLKAAEAGGRSAAAPASLLAHAAVNAERLAGSCSLNLWPQG